MSLNADNFLFLFSLFIHWFYWCISTICCLHMDIYYLIFVCEDYANARRNLNTSFPLSFVTKYGLQEFVFFFFYQTLLLFILSQCLCVRKCLSVCACAHACVSKCVCARAWACVWTITSEAVSFLGRWTQAKCCDVDINLS